MTDQIAERLTAEEFYAYADTVDERLELIEGEINIMPSPIVLHQIVLGLVFQVLSSLNRGLTLFAPLDVQLDGNNVFQPDLIWIALDRKHIVTRERIVGAPDLVVEVLSPATRNNDRRRKLRVYQRAGVREYWIIDPEGSLLDQYVLHEGRLVLQDTYGTDESFTSSALGETVAVSAFFPAE